MPCCWTGSGRSRESGILFFGLVGGVAGAIGIRAVRRRRHLYVTVAVVAARASSRRSRSACIQGWGTITIVASALLGSLMALASAALAMLVMPLAESATRITTDLTLLELSDLGRPLLRRLALEAPGTWAHSLAMANLCESACNIIGANGLLARVGCYYHDIGKLTRAGVLRREPGRRAQSARPAAARSTRRGSSGSTCSTASPWPRRPAFRRW